MQIYPSMTKVKSYTRVRRLRLLPRPGEIMVQKGQQVNPTQIIAQTDDIAGFFILAASEALGVSADAVYKYLLVEEGAKLKRGMPIMRKPSRFGRAKLFGSPVSGTLLQIRNGILVLKEVLDPINVRAMINARVESIVPKRGVILESEGSLVQGIWDSGKDGFGRLKVLTRSNEAVLDTHNSDPNIRGSILVAGRIARMGILRQLGDEGARGVVVGGMPANLCNVVKDLSYPVIITDGIGSQPMAEPIFRLFQQSQGLEASLFAQTNNHYVQRSEIVIPLPATYHDEQANGSSEVIGVGRIVRVSRLGTSTVVGKVVKVHTFANKTPIGTYMPGVDVELPGGDTVYIPYTNLDQIA